MKSDNVKTGVQQAPHRSLFNALGMTKEELNSILKECTQTCNMAYNNPLWMFLRYREYLFLYLSKYGKDWVYNYKLDFNKM